MAGYDDREFDDREKEPVDLAKATRSVSAPATGLLVVAIVGILTQIVIMVVTVAAPSLFLPMFKKMEEQAQNPDQKKQFEDLVDKLEKGATPLDFIGPLVGIIVGVVILIAALKMKRLESYGLGIAASILAMPPWISPCCCIGLPIGIWALWWSF